MKKILSLQQVWSMRDVGAEPIKVLQRVPSGGRPDTFCLIGVNGMNQAFGYYEKRPKSLIIRTADKDQWFLWYPESLPHWPAIVENSIPNRGSDYALTTHLFKNVVDAQVSQQRRVVRLATEYPPIMIEVEG